MLTQSKSLGGGYEYIAIIGDSNSQLQNINTPVASGTETGLRLYRTSSGVWGSWLGLYLGRRFEYIYNVYPGAISGTSTSVETAQGFAIGGATARSIWQGKSGTETSAFVIDTSSPYALEWMNSSIPSSIKKKTLVLVLAGTNDIWIYNRDGETTASRVIELWDKIAEKGFSYAAIAIPPSTNTTNSDRADAANSILSTEAVNRGIIWIPQFSGFRSGATMDNLYTNTDYLHTNPYGAQKIAQQVSSYISPVMTNKNMFTPPPQGGSEWLSPNPWFTGSGTYATNWSTGTTASGATLTPSLVDDSEGRWQRITISGATGTATSAAVSSSFSISNADKWYRVIGRVRYSGGGWGGLQLNIGNQFTSINARVQGTSASTISVDSNNGWLWSNPYKFPSTASSSLLSSVRLIMLGNGVFDFQSVGVVEVPNPYL